MTTFTFNSNDSSTIAGLQVLNVRRSIVGVPRDSYELVPGRAGSVLYPEAPGDRLIAITCHVNGATFADRRTALRSLAAMVTSTNRERLEFDDESDRYWLAKLSSQVDVDEWLLDADFTLEFNAEPYGISPDITDEEWDSPSAATPATMPAAEHSSFVERLATTDFGATPGSFTLTVSGVPVVVTLDETYATIEDAVAAIQAQLVGSGADLVLVGDVAAFQTDATGESATLVMGDLTGAFATDTPLDPATGSDESSSHTVTNDGTAPALPIFEITAVDEDLEGFALVVAGVELAYAGTLEAGDTLTVSAINQTVLEGTNGDADLDGTVPDGAVSLLADVDGDFPTLRAGNNIVTLVADTAAHVAVYYRVRTL